jgi:hypothetical protein
MTNILDTVEPDAIVRECAGCGGPLSRITKTTCFMDGKFNPDDPIYSRETVESMLEAHRKQVLLEAAEVSRDAMHTTTRDGYNLACSDIRDELRRMAEGDK